MERRTAFESETNELDLSLTRHISGRTKSRKNNTPTHYEPTIQSSLESLLNSGASLDPTSQALMPARSSISSLLSMSHLRLWENPMAASAISAAAAMSHLMDINHSTTSSSFGKSIEEPNISPNMCLICGRVTRDRNELENHMLSHSMDKPLECLKYGLKPNRIQGLLMSSKKRKSKHFSQNSDQPLDVSMAEVRKKRVDDCQSPKHEDNKNKICYQQSNEAINSINTNAFPCSSCHKTFATEVDLKAHLMRHLTQHPFKSERVERLSAEKTSEQNCEDETSIDGMDGEHSDDAIGDNDENHNNRETMEFGAPPLNISSRSIQIKCEKLLITMLEGVHPVTEQSYVLYKCCLCGFAFPSLEPVVLHL
ncbi:unnamed protein product, partial [Oppiella nova]